MKKKVVVFVCVLAFIVCNSIPVFAGVTKLPSTIKEGNSYEDPYTEEEDAVEDDQPETEGKAFPDTSWFDPKNQKKVYTLSTESQLKGLAQLVNTRVLEWKVNKIYTFENTTIRLSKDIKLTADWTPIGYSSTYCFKGVFDGRGHKIENLSIDKSRETSVGLFGYISGTVKNLTVDGSIKCKDDEVGGIVGHVGEGGIVEKCVSSVNVSANNKVGGVVGANNGTINRCYNLGKVDGHAKVGGVVGENYGGTVLESGNEAIITSAGKGIGTYGTGGVAGRSVASTSKVMSCFNKGNVFSVNESAGGVVGYMNAAGASIDSCYNSATITGSGSQSSVGGVVGTVGQNGVAVTNSYNAGSLKSAEYIGGVIGSYIAGIGQDLSSGIKNNYYVIDNTSLGIGSYIEQVGSKVYAGAVEPKTSGELKSTKMSTSLSPEFASDMAMMYGVNDGYPVLTWQEENGIKKEDMIDKLDINYKNEYKALYEKYPGGVINSDFPFKLFNLPLFKEDLIKEFWERKEENKKSSQ